MRKGVAVESKTLRLLEANGYRVEVVGEVHFITCRRCLMQWVYEGLGPLKERAVAWFLEHASKERSL